MNRILYVYAVVRDPVLPDEEAVDGSRHFSVASIDAISAVFTEADAAGFSQEAIDARAGDLEWLGAIGYRHQAVMTALMKQTAIVPLRAFTLFSTPDAVRKWLMENREPLSSALDRLAGRQEWTLRIELDPGRWSEALVHRVPSLAGIQQEIDTAPPGKAFLLRKKLDDEKKRAARQAEQDLLAEVERAVLSTVPCETVAESRETRDGAFPQIDVLIHRDEEAALLQLQQDLSARYGAEGVALGLTGPWPPYTFAALRQPG